MSLNGKQGDVVTIRCGQELNEDGSVRFNLRANCRYEENWILKDGENHDMPIYILKLKYSVIFLW